MPQRVQGFHGLRVSLLLAGSLMLATTSLAQKNSKATLTQANFLKKFLQNYVGNQIPRPEDERTTRFSFALVDLNGDGVKEAIVYITGQNWCGSGGCDMLILACKGASYSLVTETTITRLPIRVLRSKSHGWSDIGVSVAGGGIQFGHEAILSFDGKEYPSNPTVPPARPVTRKALGRVVIPANAAGQLLYP